jgi:hypothetical protein
VAGVLNVGGSATFEEDIIVKKKLSFLKPTGTGTPIGIISGNSGQTISLRQGFYRLIANGAGGGGGGGSNWDAAGEGGFPGGKIEIIFFVLEDITGYLISGSGGSSGESIGNQSGGPGAGGGGAGSGLIIPSLGIFMLACGGAGGGASGQISAEGGNGGLLNGTRGISVRGAGGNGGSCSGSINYGDYFGFVATDFVVLSSAPRYGGLGQKPTSDSSKAQGSGLITTVSGIGAVIPGGGGSGGGASVGNTPGGAGGSGSAVLYRLST